MIEARIDCGSVMGISLEQKQYIDMLQMLLINAGKGNYPKSFEVDFSNYFDESKLGIPATPKERVAYLDGTISINPDTDRKSFMVQSNSFMIKTMGRAIEQMKDSIIACLDNHDTLAAIKLIDDLKILQNKYEGLN